MTNYIVFAHSVNAQATNYDTLIQIASVAVVLQWIMLFYWLRLFPSLAYFITMIHETVNDCAHFFVMFVICVTMFGNANYILNWTAVGAPYDIPTSEENLTVPIYSTNFGNGYIDSILGEY